MKKEIYWQAEIVGYMEEPQADNFHVYGKWVTASTPKSQLFVDTLELIRDNGEPLWVGFGDSKELFTIQAPPNKYGQIDLLFWGFQKSNE